MVLFFTFTNVKFIFLFCKLKLTYILAWLWFGSLTHMFSQGLFLTCFSVCTSQKPVRTWFFQLFCVQFEKQPVSMH